MGFYSLDVEDNQFWGRVVGDYSGPPEPCPKNWCPEKRWYAVLHKFDGRGNHIGTDHRFSSVTEPHEERQAIDRASAKLDEMVAALGVVEYANIEIKLFSVVINGKRFGLVDVSEPDEGPEFSDRVAMEPGNLLFHAPWNGNYDT
jgi:formate hydrogenlyase regulatory protein HycA